MSQQISNRQAHCFIGTLEYVIWLAHIALYNLFTYEHSICKIYLLDGKRYTYSAAVEKVDNLKSLCITLQHAVIIAMNCNMKKYIIITCIAYKLLFKAPFQGVK